MPELRFTNIQTDTETMTNETNFNNTSSHRVNENGCLGRGTVTAVPREVNAQCVRDSALQTRAGAYHEVTIS